VVLQAKFCIGTELVEAAVLRRYIRAFFMEVLFVIINVQVGNTCIGMGAA